MRRSGLVSYRTCSLLKTGLSGRHHQPMHLSNQSWWITITFCQLVTAKGWMNDKRRKCWDYITFWNKLSKNTTGCSLFLNNLSMTEDIESSKVTTTQQKVQWTVRQGKRCQLSDRAFSTSHFFSSHLSQKELINFWQVWARWLSAHGTKKTYDAVWRTNHFFILIKRFINSEINLHTYWHIVEDVDGPWGTS